jgi:serine/threonine-protein kinase
MVSRNSHCDSNRLREFLDSPFSEDGGPCDLAEHLEHCEKCRGELEAMAGGRWWNEVRPFVRPGSDDDEPGVRTQPAGVPQAFDPDLSFLSAPDQPGHLGRFGNYQVLDVLGKGGMGVVLKAWDPALRRTVAIKVLSPMLATSGAFRQRFEREARAAAAVVHHHVVAIYHIDTDETSKLPYLVMPCISGRSLQERIDRDGPLDMPVVLRIGMQAASGLAAAHAQGIVHRDVKPANILLENGVERVVLTDFGLARAVDDASLTQSGVIAGTPQYMSPEQSRGEPADVRSDLFSLGSVLYAMCAGRPPFRASSALAVLRRVSDEEARPIREVNPAVPEGLAAVIQKLHAKDPADRYQTAAEVAAVLGQMLADLQKPVRRTAAPASKPVKLPRRKQWSPALVAVLVVVLGAGMVVVLSARNRRHDPTTLSPAGPPQDVLAAVTIPEPPDEADQDELRGHNRHVRAFLTRPGKHEKAFVAFASGKVCGDCDGDDDDGDLPIPPIPPIPPIVIDIPLGPLVRLEPEGKNSIRVVVGDAGEAIVGSGKLVTKAFDIKDFKAIDIRGPFSLELKQGKVYKVDVTADDNLFDHLQVEKVDKKLVVGFKGKNLNLHLTGDSTLKVAVTLPELEDLSLNGASRATADGFTAKQPLRLKLNGASQLKGSIKGAKVTIDVNGASTVTLAGSGKDLQLTSNGASRLKLADFDASGERLIVDANGASTVKLKGNVKAAVVKAIGASHLDLRDLALAGADVTAIGASHVVVRVSDTLDYSVTGASHLEYSGDPKIGKSNKNGASHVSHKQ